MSEPTFNVFGAALTWEEFHELYGKLHSAWNAAPCPSAIENELEDLLWEMDVAEAAAS